MLWTMYILQYCVFLSSVTNIRNLSEKDILILGIESSCDDTAAAVLRNNCVLSNVVARQEIHEQFGGVVPELAGRAHQQNIVPVVDAAIKKAGISKKELTAVAFTSGPGLLGSLIVGTSFAKAFAMALSIPLIEVNHMMGHILAHFIDVPKKHKPSFPFLCLTVSGGHTQLVMVKSPLEMQVIGTTIDDAAGEAFDKAAKLLGFPYPGGPLIDKHAVLGNPKAFSFSKPRVNGYDFSFSGLKTSILYFLQKKQREEMDFIHFNLNDLCASIQHTIIEILLEKLTKAATDFGVNEIAIAGGVSANSGLRSALSKRANEKGWVLHVPDFEYCTDNAAMIAITGKFLAEAGCFTNQSVIARARNYI
jgi:N6-L-threonylcarbamoyladenine synthase